MVTDFGSFDKERREEAVQTFVSCFTPELQVAMRQRLLATVVTMIAEHRNSERELGELSEITLEEFGSW